MHDRYVANAVRQAVSFMHALKSVQQRVSRQSSHCAKPASVPHGAAAAASNGVAPPVDTEFPPVEALPPVWAPPAEVDVSGTCAIESLEHAAHRAARETTR